MTRQHDALLILDEVMTGFRVAYGGVQTLYDIDPDLTTLGKVIGGGLPVGAYGGKREIMEHMSPVGPIYQAGTLSGNPLAMAAGITTLEILRAAPPYAALGERAAYLMDETAKAARQHGVPVYTTALGSMFTLFFSAKPVRNFDARQRLRRARLSPLLRCHAASRHLSGALAVRGRLSVHGARRRRHRSHPARRRRGPAGPVGHATAGVIRHFNLRTPTMHGAPMTSSGMDSEAPRSGVIRQIFTTPWLCIALILSGLFILGMMALAIHNEKGFLAMWEKTARARRAGKRHRRHRGSKRRAAP